MAEVPNLPASATGGRRVGRFEVARMLPDGQLLDTAPESMSVREALKVMHEGAYDQLPVMAGQTCIGVFSYRSFAERLSQLPRGRDPLDLTVAEFLEDLTFVRSTQNAGEVLEAVVDRGVVLVGNETMLLGMATAEDVVKFLWDTAHPFMLLQNFELGCRNLMQQVCSEPDVWRTCTSNAKELDEEGEPKEIHRLTLHELFNILFNGENYGRFFSEAFGKSRDIAQSTLVPVREIRNKVFHFRDEVTVNDLELLKNALTYVERRTTIVTNR